ncbi:Pentatricopeptide repeat-containing protein, chloroplastic [Symbiodinium microadriaticum]|uniref:Pentatricopeptide repeat-containing protein, chloroplastic n=1 Tax=Symbiodinium microadriaticum TaxID=2951 RepID=A0A1Q9DIJ0_SYMMI|nr:Pentatricopeptide repeat-containing protein, chloroplastic [Symbiodinium microadriaticum]
MLNSLSEPRQQIRVDKLRVESKIIRWTVAMSLLGSDWEGLWLPFSPLMIAMQACTRQSHWQRSLALFGSVSSSLSPVLYSAALSACDKGQQWRSGLQVLTTLRLERGEVDTALYNGAISMCAKAQQWQHSLALFQDLQEDRLQPDLITHNSLVSAFEKGGQWQRALAAFEETSSIGPSIVTYSGCISACARGGQWQFALFLFKEAKEQSVGVDVILCSAAITACRGDQWPRALQLLTDFEDTSRANLVAYSAAVSAIRADTAIYTSLIAACAGASSWQQAVFVLRQLRSGMLKANQITYNAVLSACENAEEWQHALEVLASLRQESIQADVASFSSAVGVCGRCWHWQQSLHLLSAALQNSVQANVILYSTAISACEKGNQWGVALHLLDQEEARALYSALQVLQSQCDSAQRVALRIDVVASSAAISACEKAGQWQRSTFLLEGLGPNAAEDL